MTNYEALTVILENERNEFKQSYDKMDKTQIYNDWYIIGFYEAYYELLMSDYVECEEYEEIFKWLGTFTHPLHFLYEEWLSADGAFDHNWDAMWDFIETVYKEEC